MRKSFARRIPETDTRAALPERESRAPPGLLRPLLCSAIRQALHERNAPDPIIRQRWDWLKLFSLYDLRLRQDACQPFLTAVLRQMNHPQPDRIFELPHPFLVLLFVRPLEDVSNWLMQCIEERNISWRDSWCERNAFSGVTPKT